MRGLITAPSLNKAMFNRPSPLVQNFSALSQWQPPEWYAPLLDNQLSNPAALHTLLHEHAFMKDKKLDAPSQHGYSLRWMRLAKRSGLLHAICELAKASQPRPVDSENPTYYRYETDNLLINWTPPSALSALFGGLGHIQVITGPVAHLTVQLDTSIRLFRPDAWISTVLSAVAENRAKVKTPPEYPPYPPHY